MSSADSASRASSLRAVPHQCPRCSRSNSSGPHPEARDGAAAEAASDARYSATAARAMSAARCSRVATAAGSEAAAAHAGTPCDNRTSTPLHSRSPRAPVRGHRAATGAHPTETVVSLRGRPIADSARVAAGANGAVRRLMIANPASPMARRIPPLESAHLCARRSARRGTRSPARSREPARRRAPLLAPGTRE